MAKPEKEQVQTPVEEPLITIKEFIDGLDVNDVLKGMFWTFSKLDPSTKGSKSRFKDAFDKFASMTFDQL